MKLQKTLFWSLVVLLPIQLTYYFWPESALIFGIRIDYLAPVAFLTDVLVIALLTVWLLAKRRRIKPGKWFWGMTTFAILNTILATRWQVAAFNWLKIAEMAGLAFYVYKNRKEVLVGMRKPLTIAVGYTTALALVQLVLQRTVGGPFYLLGERTFSAGTPGIALFNLAGRNFMRPYATFGHPNAMAGFVLASMPFLLPPGRIAAGLATIISFSQGAWLAGAGAAIVRSLKPVRVILLVAIIGSLSLPVLGGTGLIESRRLELAKIAGKIFSERPILGVGLGNFVVEVPKYQERGEWWLQPVHNLFLLVLAETGMVGFILFTFLMYRGLKAWHWALIVILLTGVVDHYWLTLQQNRLLFAIVMGLIW